MNRNLILLVAMAFAAAPFAVAHEPTGTPKNYCEDPAEWNVHDYAPPADGHLIFLGQDGNIVEDCDESGSNVSVFYCIDPLLTPEACAACPDPDDPPEICEIVLPAADFDGHIEFAFGGAWLSVTTVPECNSEVGHHPQFGPITVEDAVFGATVAFWVASDFNNSIPPTDPNEPNCGDFESDNGSECIGSCTVTFPAGLDGTYQVYVGGGVSVDTGGETPEADVSVGTYGHIRSP
jgi:hypothetical protein